MSEIPDIDIEVGIESIETPTRKWVSGYGPAKVNRLKKILTKQELEYIDYVL